MPVHRGLGMGQHCSCMPLCASREGCSGGCTRLCCGMLGPMPPPPPLTLARRQNHQEFAGCFSGKALCSRRCAASLPLHCSRGRALAMITQYCGGAAKAGTRPPCSARSPFQPGCLVVGGGCPVVSGGSLVVGGGCSVVGGGCPVVACGCVVAGGGCLMVGGGCPVVGGGCLVVAGSLSGGWSPPVTPLSYWDGSAEGIGGGYIKAEGGASEPAGMAGRS